MLALRFLLGLLAATIGAALIAIPEIAGIATWKWVLAVIGLGLFVTLGRD